MGVPLPLKNTTDEKTKECLSCINNVFQVRGHYYRSIDLLKDGRIICFDYIQQEIKIYIFLLIILF